MLHFNFCRNFEELREKDEWKNLDHDVLLEIMESISHVNIIALSNNLLKRIAPMANTDFY